LGDSNLELSFNSNKRPYLQDGSVQRPFAYLQDFTEQDTFGTTSSQMILQSNNKPMYKDANGVTTSMLTANDLTYVFPLEVNNNYNTNVTVNYSSANELIYLGNKLGIINFELDLSITNVGANDTIVSIYGGDAIPTGSGGAIIGCITTGSGSVSVAPFTLVQSGALILINSTQSINNSDVHITSSVNIVRT
jgi:hypothetical protein